MGRICKQKLYLNLATATPNKGRAICDDEGTPSQTEVGFCVLRGEL